MLEGFAVRPPAPPGFELESEELLVGNGLELSEGSGLPVPPAVEVGLSDPAVLVTPGD
jgi:hypothetical protein